jgi:hypothetical protein
MNLAVYILSFIVTVPLSWLFFRRVVQSNVGEAWGLQKLKNGNYGKRVNTIINVVLGIALAATMGVINSLIPDDTASQVFVKGGCMGLALGLYGAIKPERIKE